MKLSKEQQRILDGAKLDIDKARACANLGEYWAIVDNGYYLKRGYTFEEYLLTFDDEERDKKIAWKTQSFENHKNGIVYAWGNSRSLKRLELLGLIEIIKDAGGVRHGIDTIKVLNY